MTTPASWDPQCYGRFAAERRQPFFDLLALVVPERDMRVLDLGCGTGELTARLHAHLGAALTLGLDRSQSMLDGRPAAPVAGLHFVRADMERLPLSARFDLVFSNAALHWLDDHAAVLASLAELLVDGGQLALQVPANEAHASHVVAVEVAATEPFASALAGWVRRSPVLHLESYALILRGLGFDELHVRAQLYLHELDGLADLVAWMRGTTLGAYARRLPEELWPAFLEAYGARLAERLPAGGPLLFPFRRVLLWARR